MNVLSFFAPYAFCSVFFAILALEPLSQAPCGVRLVYLSTTGVPTYHWCTYVSLVYLRITTPPYHSITPSYAHTTPQRHANPLSHTHITSGHEANRKIYGKIDRDKICLRWRWSTHWRPAPSHMHAAHMHTHGRHPHALSRPRARARAHVGAAHHTHVWRSRRRRPFVCVLVCVCEGEKVAHTHRQHMQEHETRELTHAMTHRQNYRRPHRARPLRQSPWAALWARGYS
jgi:hypothetical protein